MIKPHTKRAHGGDNNGVRRRKEQAAEEAAEREEYWASRRVAPGELQDQRTQAQLRSLLKDFED